MSLRSIFVYFCALFSVNSAPLHAFSFDPGASPPFAAALLMEAETGAILYAYNPHLQRSPASTQKILLELVVMELIEQGKYSLDDSIQVSAQASRVGGSQVYLSQGEVFTLGELMEAVALPSANDACVAVAEHLGGSPEGFADMMTACARRLGLEHTRCVNVHGLDDTPVDAGNVTTAYDLAQIARQLIRYPQALHWSSLQTRPFRNGKFILHNTNKLLGRFPGLDGLKTGYTARAGFCLVATAERDSMRLISVILGTPSERIRRRETARLLNWGFNNFSRVPLVQADELLGTVALDWGLEPEVRVHAQDTVFAVLRPEQKKQLNRQLDLPTIHPAPIRAGEGLGTLKITLGDSLLAQVDIVAAKSVGRMNFWDKLMSYF